MRYRPYGTFKRVPSFEETEPSERSLSDTGSSLRATSDDNDNTENMFRTHWKTGPKAWWHRDRCATLARARKIKESR